MTAQDFPVTLRYRSTAPPYGTAQNPYHKGCDRKMPIGTPVIVNGVQIGLSGVSGWVDGPHLHTGRFVNGLDTNPQDGGFSFNNATVTQIGEDSRNGKYVRLQADGASWVYLHLSQPTVQFGQVLHPPAPQPVAIAQPTPQGGNEMIANTDQAQKLYRMLRPNGGASDGEINATAGHRSFAEFVNSAQGEVNARDAVLRDQAGRLEAMQAAITTANQTVANLQTADNNDQQALQTAQAKLTELLTDLAVSHAEVVSLQQKLTTATVPKPVPVVSSFPAAKTPSEAWIIKLLAVLAKKP